jgi:membrane-bound lytic murein transglycosylase D
VCFVVSRIFPAAAFALLPAAALAAEPATPPATPPDPDDLYELGRALFEEYAPPEIQQQFRFPTPQEWDQFAQRLQAALQSDRLDELAAYESEARAALAALRAWPDYEDLADWLTQRLDLIEGAREAVQPAPTPPAPPPPPPPAVRAVPVPYYGLWLARLKSRPVPPRAAGLLPQVRREFTAAGLPPNLAWLAEVESGFNPRARSPAGARGLYQLMPATARDLGLSAFLPDERTDPAKNARAAARYLRALHGQFNDWPLALAAYNAGPGRIRRALTARKARTFADIAPALPAETRMYVPKVFATLATRAGPAATALPPPRALR